MQGIRQSIEYTLRYFFQQKVVTPSGPLVEWRQSAVVLGESS